MEETFEIAFESLTERFKIKIKSDDFDKLATLIYNMCIDNKISAEVTKEDK